MKAEAPSGGRAPIQAPSEDAILGSTDGQNASANEPVPQACSRRRFLSGMGSAGAAGIAAGLIGASPASGSNIFEKEAASEQFAGLGGKYNRAAEAYKIRHQAALYQRKLPQPAHPTNGDESRYFNRIGNYSKGLPHNALGEVTPAAYGALLLAIKSRLPLFFERIPMGCSESGRRLVNPQAGLAFDLQGADSHHLAIPPAPAFASAEAAAEMAELYWMALARDVPFSQYDTHPITNMAAEDLSRLSGFYGPRVEGRVTPSTLFRGLTPGDLVGPYISQFLCRPVPFGSQFIEPRMRSVLPGIDYMTNLDEFLAIQNGCPPALADQFDETRRYVLCGRDLAQWVHVDVLFQAYFNAAMILLAPLHPDPLVSGIGAPYNPGNPYLASANQEGFGTFGPPALATLVCEVATRALKAVWYQKWFVHRRLRPEEYGGRVHQRISGAAKYPIHRDLLNSAAPAAVYGLYGTWLLPQAFPEGSPLHPSYGAGHATVAGACVTILKAFFDENYVIPNPLVPHPDNPAELIPYEGPPLTVGGELNKLAANVAQGRNFAGIHWRTDYSASVALGEAVAISVLLDQRATCNEKFDGYTFTRFDGTTMTV